MGSCISCSLAKKSFKDNQHNIEWKDTSPFIIPLNDGYVIKVYDGDTITVANKLPIINDDTVYRFSIRLKGIDTPEIKGKTEDERTAAKLARDIVSEKILHKHILLKNVSMEKYGRILADVWLDDFHLNKWLIDNRYALEYNGGTKTCPSSWNDYRINGITL